jgi:hypothetical protein
MMSVRTVLFALGGQVLGQSLEMLQAAKVFPDPGYPCRLIAMALTSSSPDSPIMSEMAASFAGFFARLGGFFVSRLVDLLAVGLTI